MIGARKRRRKGPTVSSRTYRDVFVTRVHQLLELAYRRTDARSFQLFQETAITGELVRVMDAIVDDPTSPRWVRHFSIHDDPPVNVPGRLGRSRKRLDIKILSAQSVPRNRFAFEAKRLGKDNPIRDYLGDEGLGCFLAGHYAREEGDAGMLGYVQSDTPNDWANKLDVNIADGAKKLGLIAGHAWKRVPIRNGPAHTYRTRHSRRDVGQHIDVYHTLLAFC